jgi:hypothetical protein
MDPLAEKIGREEPNREELLRSIEDLRTEVRELRQMVNVLVEMIYHLEVHEETEPEMDSNMMSYDSLFKSGRYCM